MYVIARQGDDYLIALFAPEESESLPEPERLAVVFETGENEVTMSLPVESVLARGYWKDATMPQEELYRLLAGANHIPDRDGRTRALDLLPVGIK